MAKQNLGFHQSSILFETLAERIYTDPHVTSIRETLANALDIHKKVGTPRKVDLDFSYITYNTMLVTIRDYGTGISDEEYADAYTFFSSKKKNSSGTSGEYGLGAKSPYGILYRNNKKIEKNNYMTQFYVSSIQNGVCTTRVHFLDDNLIPSYDTIAHYETNMSDGLMVQFYTDHLLDDLPIEFYLAVQGNVHCTVNAYQRPHRKTSQDGGLHEFKEKLDLFKSHSLSAGIDLVYVPTELVNTYAKNDVYFKVGDLVYKDNYGLSAYGYFPDLVDYIPCLIIDLGVRQFSYNIPSSRDSITLTDKDAFRSFSDGILYSLLSDASLSNTLREYRLNNIKKFSDVRNINKVTYDDLVLCTNEENKIPLILTRPNALANLTRLYCTDVFSTKRTNGKSVSDSNGKIIGSYIGNGAFSVIDKLPSDDSADLNIMIVFRDEKVYRNKITELALLGKYQFICVVDNTEFEALKEDLESLSSILDYTFLSKLPKPKVRKAASKPQDKKPELTTAVSRLSVNGDYRNYNTDLSNLDVYYIPQSDLSRYSGFSGTVAYEGIYTKKYGEVKITSNYYSNVISVTNEEGVVVDIKIPNITIVSKHPSKAITQKTTKILDELLANGKIKHISDIVGVDVETHELGHFDTILWLLFDMKVDVTLSVNQVFKHVRRLIERSMSNGKGVEHDNFKLLKTLYSEKFGKAGTIYKPCENTLSQLQGKYEEFTECDKEICEYFSSQNYYVVDKLEKTTMRIVRQLFAYDELVELARKQKSTL